MYSKDISKMDPQTLFGVKDKVSIAQWGRREGGGLVLQYGGAGIGLIPGRSCYRRWKGCWRDGEFAHMLLSHTFLSSAFFRTQIAWSGALLMLDRRGIRSERCEGELPGRPARHSTIHFRDAFISSCLTTTSSGGSDANRKEQP